MSIPTKTNTFTLDKNQLKGMTSSTVDIRTNLPPKDKLTTEKQHCLGEHRGFICPNCDAFPLGLLIVEIFLVVATIGLMIWSVRKRKGVNPIQILNHDEYTSCFEKKGCTSSTFSTIFPK